MNKFIYPTKKNMLLFFFLMNIFGLVLFLFIKPRNVVGFWISLEFLLLTGIINWQLKPIDNMDERDIRIDLKWKSKMYTYGTYSWSIPVLLLTFYPKITGWIVLIITLGPMFLVQVYCSFMQKKEHGGSIFYGV